MKFLEVFGLSFALCMAVIEVRVGAMSSRIVGGATATLGQFPYQVSLRFRNKICGGSIISRNFIVTAAHCVTNRSNGTKYDASEIIIRAGTINRDSGGVDRGVSEIKVHPEFSFPQFDIALLKLAKPLTFTNNIKPIGLVNAAVPTGGSILASGWGYRSTNGTSPTELQYVYLNVASANNCLYHWTVLCVESRRGLGICQGDSGGPGVHNGKLAGVVSFTSGLCGTDLPDGFAKISVLHDWIINNSDYNNKLHL